MYEIVNDEALRKESNASIHKNQSISREDRFFKETKTRIERAVFDIKMLMTRDVKRFNNSLKDKFLELLNENISRRFRHANLNRRRDRSRNEDKKGGKREHSYPKKDKIGQEN